MTLKSSYRRNGIASLLLKTLIDHLSEFDQKANLKAIYLHVLTSNRAAILFYERHEWVESSKKSSNFNIYNVFYFSFIMHAFLPYYYSIRGTAKDAFLYIKFLNGYGLPPSIIQIITENCVKVFNFNVFRWIASRFRYIISWVNFHSFSKKHLVRQ